MTAAPPTSYVALALQTTCRAIRGLSRDDARAAMKTAIERIGRRAAAAKAFIGQDVKLIVLPEYVLTGFPIDEPIGAWRDLAAIAADGPEAEAFGAISQRLGVFLCVNAYEADPAFPGLYFQTNFIFDPAGAIALTYRRLISMFAPSPYDLWRRGAPIETLFPVAHTSIGVLASVASEEILFPELARILAARGAEVIAQPTGEAASPRPTAKSIARAARAAENGVYVVCANAAGLHGIDIGEASTDAMSAIVDFRGDTRAEAGSGETMACSAEIDLAALRRHRRRPGLANTFARQPHALWAAAYAALEGQPPGTLLREEKPFAPDDRTWFRARQQAVIDRMIDAGLI